MNDFDLDIDEIIDAIEPRENSDLDEEGEYDFGDSDEPDIEIKISLAHRFYKTYERYKTIFGDTFDSYLLMKGSDEEIENAIAAMEDAIKSGKPVTSADLGLPEAEAPKDEWDTPDLL